MTIGVMKSGRMSTGMVGTTLMLKKVKPSAMAMMVYGFFSAKRTSPMTYYENSERKANIGEAVIAALTVAR